MTDRDGPMDRRERIVFYGAALAASLPGIALVLLFAADVSRIIVPVSIAVVLAIAIFAGLLHVHAWRDK